MPPTTLTYDRKSVQSQLHARRQLNLEDLSVIWPRIYYRNLAVIGGQIGKSSSDPLFKPEYY